MELTELRERMAAYLREEEIPAIAAWPREERRARGKPLVVVSLESLQGEGSGFQNYLGEVFDRGMQSWIEVYGQALKVGYRLELYSPRRQGEEGCRLLLGQVAAALGRGGPAGLRMESWSAAEPVYEEESGMLRGRMTVWYRGMLLANQDPQGVLSGIRVKGEVTVDAGSDES